MRRIAIAVALAFPFALNAQTFTICDPVSTTVSFCPDEEVSQRFAPGFAPGGQWYTLPGLVDWYRIRGRGIATRSATTHMPDLRFDAEQVEMMSAGLKEAVAGLDEDIGIEIDEATLLTLESGSALRVTATLSDARTGLRSDFVVTVVPAETGSVALWTTPERDAHPVMVLQVHDSSVQYLVGARP